MTTKSIKGQPWYKEFYVWLVIFFPMLAVVAGIYTIRLAILSDDGLVADDYYKRGLEINLTLNRDKRALAQQMQADIELQPKQQRLFLTLHSGDKDYSLPNELTLHLQYSTRAGHDQHLQLKRVGDNDYFAALSTELINGNWIMELAGDDWRLVKTVHLPRTSHITMQPLSHLRQ